MVDIKIKIIDTITVIVDTVVNIVGTLLGSLTQWHTD